nr:MAG TPA: hypothetical protein [Caudoviricetes sp.]
MRSLPYHESAILRSPPNLTNPILDRLRCR